MTENPGHAMIDDQNPKLLTLLFVFGYWYMQQDKDPFDGLSTNVIISILISLYFLRESVTQPIVLYPSLAVLFFSMSIESEQSNIAAAVLTLTGLSLFKYVDNSIV